MNQNVKTLNKYRETVGVSTTSPDIIDGIIMDNVSEMQEALFWRTGWSFK